MKVAITNAGMVPIPRLVTLGRLAEKVLRGEGMKGNVNLVFCENDYVRNLNKQFRKLDKVTDVLSFVYDDEDILGEIYIASALAQKQAPRWKNSFYDELRRLVVHGALHLSGYDHMIAKDRNLMRSMEDKYLLISKPVTSIKKSAKHKPPSPKNRANK
jgi:probable rRNA maturation factor